MRENIGLFRGKRMDNKKWVEGSFYQHPMTTKDCFILVHNYYSSAVYGFGNLGCPEFHKVDPDTVGECTGLKDKNSKLIWEGDIIKTKHGVRRIVFDDGCFGAQRYVNGVATLFANLKSYNRELNGDWEVIGNIHDNPELLKEGTDNDN